MIDNDTSYRYSSVLAIRWPWTCLFKYNSSDTGYAYGLHGALQATQLDKTKKTISGTFSFTYINSASGFIENVQNGSFENVPY